MTNPFDKINLRLDMSKFVKPSDLVYPTIKEMNSDNNSLRVHLQILRCMNTSDLSFHYMLYDAETVRGMVHQAESHYEFCRTDPTIYPWFRDALTTIEHQEYRELCKDLEDYADLEVEV